MTDYEVLKAFGFSAFKAAEVELDVKRKVPYALMWLQIARDAVTPHQLEVHAD